MYMYLYVFTHFSGKFAGKDVFSQVNAGKHRFGNNRDQQSGAGIHEQRHKNSLLYFTTKTVLKKTEFEQKEEI